MLHLDKEAERDEQAARRQWGPLCSDADSSEMLLRVAALLELKVGFYR